jgi:hypothetical protein
VAIILFVAGIPIKHHNFKMRFEFVFGRAWIVSLCLLDKTPNGYGGEKLIQI